MKLSLRVTMLTAMLTVLGLAMGLQGVNAFRTSRYTVEDLSGQLFEQASLRIEREIEFRLSAASHQSNMTKKLLDNGTRRVDDFPELVSLWRVMVDSHFGQSGLFVGLESGESVGITRATGAALVWEVRRDPKTAKLIERSYLPDNYPEKPAHVSPAPPLDIRERPWYRQARNVGHPTWTDVYVFLGSAGHRDIHGVSYATPIFDKQNNLTAVLDSSFQLVDLCEFLMSVRVAEHGYAFVLERGPAGRQHVIIHPNADLILKPVPGSHSVLMPIDEFADPVVRALVSRLTDHDDGQGPLEIEANGQTYFAAHQRLKASARYPSNWTICVVVPKIDVLARVEDNFKFGLWLAIAILVLAAGIAYLIARQVARPLERLGKETVAIGNFEIEPRPVAHSAILEVDRLAVAVEDMKTSLRSFQKFVPADLVRQLVHQEASLGGERRALTICFCDLQDSTTIAESTPPEAFVEQLRDYLGALSSEIESTGGTVDKFIGDAVMAFWGAPKAMADHALAACAAALRCQERMRQLRAEWHQRGWPPFHTRIGLNTGEVVVGNIGSAARLNYTVIGDPVNLAARLEGVNKRYGTGIMISEHTRRAAGESIVVRLLDAIVVKGKTQSVQIYELVGLKDEVDEATLRWLAAYNEALERYRQRDWAHASDGFTRALTLRQGDAAAQLMIEQCRRYQHEPPPPDWDGVYHSDAH